MRVWLLLLCWWPVSAFGKDTIRIGLFVGNDLGFGGDSPLQAAEREARDLARVFQAMGGMKRERVQVLVGGDAAALDSAIREVEAQVREAAARGSSVMLIFYYSGHASREGLHMRGSLMPMDRIERWLRQSVAQIRIAFVDGCESGSLARLRGGTPVETIDLQMDDSLLSYGYAVVTSAGPLSVARESEAFGGGIFSTALIAGLRGSADIDQSGGVTLEEAYNYAFRETVVGTARAGHGVQRPEYHTKMTGVGQVILTRMTDREAGLVLAAELEGVYTVVSVATGQVVARISKSPGRDRRMALPAGRYVVRKVRQSDVLVAELDLAWGGDRWVDDAQMTVLQLGDPLSRGAAPFDRPIRASLLVTGGTPIVSNNPFALGAELGVRVRGRNRLVGVAASVGIDRGTLVPYGSELTSYAGVATFGLYAQRHLRRIDLVIGGGAAGLRLEQRLRLTTGGTRNVRVQAIQHTGAGYGEVGIHAPVGPAVGFSLGTRLLTYPANAEGTVRLFVRGHARAGIELRLGGRVRRSASRKPGSSERSEKVKKTRP